MAAPQEILHLVETFDRNIETYKTSQLYNETQLRREFIDPFFEALGWDVTNKHGFAPAYRDVIHEDAIRIGSTIKAPDYCFTYGFAKKFFLEAKKPSAEIKNNKEHAYQLRCYAWSAKLALSILTNFDEFAVYDCQSRPKESDPASTGRIIYLNYKEYIDKWDQIAEIFSKEAVLKGSFDKFITSTKTKKGTTTVDIAFLAEIENWRETFAKTIAHRNIKLTVEQINFAVQKTIDRIIFLRMCEDRGIETYGQLLSLINGDNVYPRLCTLFEKADAKYNSGLFHFRKESDRTEPPDELTLNLAIDDKDIKYILNSLYYPKCPYVFSYMPPEILGNVYEQFLGKVIRLTLARQVKIEEKPEVKKAGGIYYTPSYIVDYIVKNTVGKLCEGKTPKQLEDIKILDPACGSGSFLLGAFTYLLNYIRDWYFQNDPAKYQKQIYQGRGGHWFLTISEKKKILLNNIFGVDIDQQAVEVTKLSLLLKVLEGETGETIGQTYKMFHERALPDLGNSIKCGNSLIGPDFFESKDTATIDPDEYKKINPFDWQKEFPDIFKQGGFDIVIGNPPYGAEFTQVTFEYLKLHFKTCVWRGESYLLFVEKSISMLNEGGQFGYIIPDTYLNLGFTKSLRSFLLNQTIIHEIVSLPASVFDTATVDTTLMFVEKAKPTKTFYENNVLVKIFKKDRAITSVSDPNREFSISTKLWHDQNAFIVHSEPKQIAIASKIELQHHILSEFAEIFYGIKVYQVGKGNPPQTEKIRQSKPFTSDHQTDSTYLPMFDGKHIGRYTLLWKRNNWVKYGPWLAEPRQPEKYQGEKLLIRKIVGKTLIATYFSKTSYCNTLLYALKLKPKNHLTYLYCLGILNSQFIGWYFRQKFQISESDTFPQIMIRDILQFPMPNFDKAKHDKMVALVESMLDLHKKLQKEKIPDEKVRIQRQIDSTDRQIDCLAYDLYGLTADEIDIVEGRDISIKPQLDS